MGSTMIKRGATLIAILAPAEMVAEESARFAPLFWRKDDGRRGVSFAEFALP
jgi:hypothetical protein